MKHDQDYIKKQNKSMVLGIIRTNGPISRASIARMTSMSPTSISKIVSELADLGLVHETEPCSHGVGRKAALISIYPHSTVTIGAYLNRDVMRVGIVDFSGRVVQVKELHYQSSNCDADYIADLLAGLIKQTVDSLGEEPPCIIGVGIGMPGIIDTTHGRIILSAQLGWNDVEFMERMKNRTGMDIIIDNTVKLKALAENLCGVARCSKNTALISIGSGVGSAMVIDGQIMRGELNIAGEVGHITVDPNGMLCECGRQGCLQTFIAEGALLLQANEVKKTDSIDRLFESAVAGEAWALGILERAAMYVAIAINNVACMYSPDTIILSGKLIENYPLMVELVEERLDLVWEPFRDTFKLVYSEGKQETVLIGAATLALNTFLQLD